MRALLCAPLALLGWPSFAAAQVLTPTGQDRSIVADASLDGTTNSDTDQASTFDPFLSNVSVSLSTPGSFAMSGADQDSQVLACSFVGTGSQSSSTGDGGAAHSDSRAELEFQIAVTCQYHVVGVIEGYDGGFGEWSLEAVGGTWIDGDFGIAEGPIPIDSTGELPAGSYTVLFHAFGGSAGSNQFSFSRYDLQMDLTPLASNYCVSDPNSAGTAAVMGLSGSQSIARNDCALEVTGAVPGEFGFFFYGPDEVQVPLGHGHRCVGGVPLIRLGVPVGIDSAGSASRPLDFTVPPMSSGPGEVLPGSTWKFQFWYRDPASGPPGVNLSDGLSVTFCP